jgi:hypothetical protein
VVEVKVLFFLVPLLQQGFLVRVVAEVVVLMVEGVMVVSQQQEEVLVL